MKLRIQKEKMTTALGRCFVLDTNLMLKKILTLLYLEQNHMCPEGS
ncbi:hypothetical protein F1210_003015 [Clostridioides difficile]